MTPRFKGMTFLLDGAGGGTVGWERQSGSFPIRQYDDMNDPFDLSDYACDMTGKANWKIIRVDRDGEGILKWFGEFVLVDGV